MGSYQQVGRGDNLKLFGKRKGKLKVLRVQHLRDSVASGSPLSYVFLPVYAPKIREPMASSSSPRAHNPGQYRCHFRR